MQELPWTGDGLSLTQRLALQPPRSGPQTVSELFWLTQLESEPLPFLGDLMFWSILRDMQRVAAPPFTITAETAGSPWPRHRLALTPAGEALLAGGRDWLEGHPPERWVGGVQIAPSSAIWRWDDARGKPAQR